MYSCTSCKKNVEYVTGIYRKLDENNKKLLHYCMGDKERSSNFGDVINRTSEASCVEDYSNKILSFSENYKPKKQYKVFTMKHDRSKCIYVDSKYDCAIYDNDVCEELVIIYPKEKGFFWNKLKILLPYPRTVYGEFILFHSEQNIDEISLFHQYVNAGFEKKCP